MELMVALIGDEPLLRVAVANCNARPATAALSTADCTYTAPFPSVFVTA